MSITPRDLINNKKNSDKILAFNDICLDDVSIDDLSFNGDNYDNYIALNSFFNQVSSCQISDAFNLIARRSGVISKLKSINNLKVWGRVFTCKTTSDDWGTIAIGIDKAQVGDVLFVEVNNMDAAIWGELASVSAKNKGVKATFVYGCVRDMDALLYIDYPIFACGFRPNAGKSLGLGEFNIDLDLEDIKISPGDFIFGDETGVVVIPESFFKQVIVQTYDIKVGENDISNELKGGVSLSHIVGLD